MNPMVTAHRVSLEQLGPGRYELILSPDFDSSTADLLNATRADQFRRKMIALGYTVIQTQDHSDCSGRLVLRFKK